MRFCFVCFCRVQMLTSVDLQYITKTCPCNMKQFLKAVKMINCDMFHILLKTWTIGTR